MISPTLLAQALPGTSSGVDWLYQFTNNLTNLTTQNGGALTQLGLTELSCIALFTLISMVINWNTSGMTVWRFHAHPVRAGDLTHFLLQLIVCCLLINYWVNPLPGASFGLNHFFSYIAQVWTYLFSFLLLRRMGLSKPIRYALAVFLIGLIWRFSSTPSFCFSTLRKGRIQPMTTRESTAGTSLTPAQSLLVDHIGNEVYASHYAERKVYRLILACGTVMLLASLGMNLMLARRPIANRYIRIDEMGRAQAIQYSDLNYSPREGEVRTYLTDWANYRYTVNRDVIAKKYPLNYYFLSQALASRLMTEDNANHLVSQVTAGQIEASDVQVQNVTITTMSEEMLQGARIARGTALMAVDRFYSAENSHEPRTEHWLLSITYYLNPKQVSDQSRVYPQYEFINPLGLTITEFHENRVSADAHNPDSTAGATR